MRAAPPLALLAALVAALAVAPARAQHGMTNGPRALHERLAAADVIALATVEDVRPDRVVLRDAVVLRGEAGPSFELKRAPSKEIPYAAGLAFLLPLRGARPPYVLVDDAREVVVLRDDAAIATWRAALPALLAAGDDREALVATYLAWLDGPDDALRDVAAAALVDPRTGLLPLSPARAVARAQAALDPALPVATRRVSALLATSRPEGVQALLDGALAAPSADPQVVETALRAAVQARTPGLDDALLAALTHGDAAVRRVAVQLVETSGSAPGRAHLPAVAAHDPDEAVRREARKALGARGVASD